MLTPLFFVSSCECSLHVAQNTMFHGSFPPNSGQILAGFWVPVRRIPEQINIVPTCLMRNP
jgi:hypothetical protein